MIATIQIKLLTETAQIPKSARNGDIGADIYSDENTIIPSRERKLISTGISISPLAADGYIRIAPRSGLSVKGIETGAGVIDPNFLGEIKVLLINNSKQDFFVNKGDRIAQMIWERASNISFLEVDSLPETQRGSGGFGSSGK